MIAAIPSDEKEVLFSHLLELWLRSSRLKHKGSTQQKYRYMINTHINPELGNLHLDELNAPRINGFLCTKLEAGRLQNGSKLSPSYVNSMRLIIHSALSFAAEEGLCEPLRTPLHKPQNPGHELTILSRDQQKRLETHIAQAPSPTGAGIFLSLRLGLRIGEVCALQWENIDFDRCLIHIRKTVSRVPAAGSTAATLLVLDTPKTPHSRRDIPFSSEVAATLAAVRKTRPDSAFVVSAGESFLSPRTYDYRFHRLLERLGLPPINYHALRHTFATRCVEAGVDIKTLSKILGHSNVAVTLNVYVHSSLEKKRRELEKLDFL